MVTTDSPSPSSEQSGDQAQVEEKGFVGNLVGSIFEPGANYAVVIAMNVSFFLLILVLLAMAIVSNGNKHVVFMLVVSTLLWASMAWFVMELSKVQSRPDNMPITGGVDETTPEPEAKKDR